MLNCKSFYVYLFMTAKWQAHPSKDDIKCTLQADHGNAEGRGCENTTGMPTLAKTTLNVPYWLTTQMGPAARDGVTGLLY